MYRWTCHALPLDLSRVAVGLVTPPPRQRINLIGFFARPGPYSRRIYEILRPHPRAPRSGGGVRSAPAPFSRGSPTNTRPRRAARGETLRGWLTPGLSPAPQGRRVFSRPPGSEATRRSGYIQPVELRPQDGLIAVSPCLDNGELLPRRRRLRLRCGPRLLGALPTFLRLSRRRRKGSLRLLLSPAGPPVAACPRSSGPRMVRGGSFNTRRKRNERHDSECL